MVEQELDEEWNLFLLSEVGCYTIGAVVEKARKHDDVRVALMLDID